MACKLPYQSHGRGNLPAGGMDRIIHYHVLRAKLNNSFLHRGEAVEHAGCEAYLRDTVCCSADMNCIKGAKAF